MALSMFQVTVPVFIRQLNSLAQLLKKGEIFADSKNIDHQVLLTSRLAADMFPLIRQVQIATDLSRRCVARLVDDELIAIEDNETSFDELYQRIDATIAYLESVSSSKIDGTENKSLTVKRKDRTLDFSGDTFVLKFSIPNVFFHVSTAYAILRSTGVNLEKIDFIGDLP